MFCGCIRVQHLRSEEFIAMLLLDGGCSDGRIGFLVLVRHDEWSDSYEMKGRASHRSARAALKEWCSFYFFFNTILRPSRCWRRMVIRVRSLHQHQDRRTTLQAGETDYPTGRQGLEVRAARFRQLA